MDLRDTVRGFAADVNFSGVVRIDAQGSIVVAECFGFADRAHQIPVTHDTQFGLASGAKGFTALTVMSMVEAGEIDLGDLVRPMLGHDLPLVDDRVTIEHLLTHRSGIGDYLDESLGLTSSDYLMPVPVHQLASTDDYLKVLGGHAQKFEPGTRFEYCNSGFVVLAAIAERITGVPFQELVEERVCARAGLSNTAFLRSDELPGGAALGYIDADGFRTNVLHLPVRGHGDGGIFSTVADLHRLWAALDAGVVVAPPTYAAMLHPRVTDTGESLRYGLGLWLHPTGLQRSIHGFDAGVGFVSAHDPSRSNTYTVIANQSIGAWPLSQRIGDLLDA